MSEEQADYRDIDLSSLQRVLGHDGIEAVREAIRQIEEANRTAREGGTTDQVVASLESAKSYLDSGIGWAR
jgi:hypothetical protein